MRLQQQKNGVFFTTLPKAIVLAKGWGKGEEIIAKINERGEIVLKKVPTPLPTGAAHNTDPSFTTNT